MAAGLIQCLDEIADENNMKAWLQKHLGAWKEKYAKEIRAISNRQLDGLLSHIKPEPVSIANRQLDGLLSHIKPEPVSIAAKPEAKQVVFRGVKLAKD